MFAVKNLRSFHRIVSEAPTAGAHLLHADCGALQHMVELAQKAFSQKATTFLSECVFEGLMCRWM